MLRTFAASWTPVATSVLKTMVAVGSDGSASHCSPQATPVCRCNRSARRGPAPRSDLGTAFRLQNLRGIPVLIVHPSVHRPLRCGYVLTRLEAQRCLRRLPDRSKRSSASTHRLDARYRQSSVSELSGRASLLLQCYCFRSRAVRHPPRGLT